MNKFLTICLFVLFGMFSSSVILSQDKNEGKIEYKNLLNMFNEGEELLVFYTSDNCQPCVQFKIKVLLSPRIQARTVFNYRNRYFFIDVNDSKNSEIIKLAKLTVTPTLVRYRIEKGKIIELTRLETNASINDTIKFLDKEFENTITPFIVPAIDAPPRPILK